jgi:hypothetical protein
MRVSNLLSSWKALIELMKCTKLLKTLQTDEIVFAGAESPSQWLSLSGHKQNKVIFWGRFYQNSNS